MGILTVLKLQTELRLTRAAMIERPKVTCEWTVDPGSGRSTATWAGLPEGETLTVTLDPEIG